MAFNRTTTSQSTRKFNQAREKRIAEMDKFPLQTEITFNFNNESLGIVIEHDLVMGRLKTNKNGSYDPFEMAIFKKGK